MKIAVIGRRHLFHIDDCAEEYGIADAFRSFGDFVTFYEEKDLEGLNEKVDLVFLAKVAKDRKHLEEIKQKFNGAPIAYWMPDHCLITKTDEEFRKMVRGVDFYIGRLLEFTEWFEENGIRYFYWNYDVADYLYKKESDPRVTVTHPQTSFPDVVPVGFIGNDVHNPSRAMLLKGIQDRVPDLHITTITIREFDEKYGLKNLHNPLYGRKFNQLVDITKINLSIEGNTTYGFWSPRTARIMVAGGFALVQERPGMRERFRDNVVFFGDAWDAAMKIEYYLEHEDERKAIADRGRMFAEGYLRPEHRVKELRDYLLTVI